MPTSASTPFNCPNCKASYKLVRVKAPPVINENQLTCLSCGGPLTAREGGFVLKYFFIQRNLESAAPCHPGDVFRATWDGARRFGRCVEDVYGSLRK